MSNSSDNTDKIQNNHLKGDLTSHQRLNTSTRQPRWVYHAASSSRLGHRPGTTASRGPAFAGIRQLKIFKVATSLNNQRGRPLQP